MEVGSYSSQFSQTPKDSSSQLCLHLLTPHAFLTGSHSLVPTSLLNAVNAMITSDGDTSDDCSSVSTGLRSELSVWRLSSWD